MEHAIALICLAAIVSLACWRYWRDYKKRHADHPLFLTHTPGGFSVGIVRDGYEITRLERVSPTALTAGGSAQCWQVYGVKTQNARQ